MGSGILIATWVLALLVVGGYVWFVVWRVRVDKRKKAAAATDDSDRMNAALAAAARLAATETAAPTPPSDMETSPTAAAESTTPLAPSAATTRVDDVPAKSTTVAGALSGINLPNGLTPLTMVAARPGVGDRVVFSTRTAPAETVGTALGDELERLGYDVRPLDPQTIAATRGDQRLILVIHPDGATAKIGDEKAFASVPDLSVVVEVWIP